VLGIVSDEYEVVDHRDAFRFLDALIGSDLHFETAGSLWGGRRVWCLARLPEYIELGGDPSATYLYVANSHDGSMAVTAAATPIRIVCANTLGTALRQAERGASAQRTFRFVTPAICRPSSLRPARYSGWRSTTSSNSRRSPIGSRASRSHLRRSSIASCATCG
jgi:hypothetical protein